MQQYQFDSVHDSQVVFRRLLHAMANPGSEQNIREQAIELGENGALLALAITLLDMENSYHISPYYTKLNEQIRLLTGSHQETLECADIIFLSAHEDKTILNQLKPGTFENPHESATVFIASDGEVDIPCALAGPGVPPTGRSLKLTVTEVEWLITRDALELEYPLGIDLVFIRNDSFIAFPRTTRHAKGVDSWLM